MMLAARDAESGDYGKLRELYKVLKSPYADVPETPGAPDTWVRRSPAWALRKAGVRSMT